MSSITMLIIVMIILIIAVAVALFIRYKKRAKVDEIMDYRDKVIKVPLSDELAQVKRLNMKGQAEKLYKKWMEEWANIQSYDIEDIDAAIFEAEELYDRFSFQKADSRLAKANDKLDIINERISMIRNDLTELLHSEKENKALYEELIFKYKEARRDLLAKRHVYGTAANKIEIELNDLEPELETYRHQMSVGNYLEAKAEVQHTYQLMQRIEEEMQSIPELIKEIEREIPLQLSQVRDRAEELTKAGYQLKELQINEKLDAASWQLADAKESVKNTDIESIEDNLDDIYDLVENILRDLKAEVDARSHFDANFAKVRERLYQQDDLNDYLFKEIGEVKAHYQVYEKDEAMIERYYDTLSQLISLEESIDVALNNQARLPYSVLNNKMNHINDSLDEIEKDQNEYYEYLSSLRGEEHRSKDILYRLNQEKERVYYQIKTAKAPGFSERFEILKRDVEHAILSAETELARTPINIDELHRRITSVQSALEAYRDNVRTEIQYANLVERLVQYSNRYRNNNVEFSQKLDKVEQTYREFRYKKAVEDAKKALESVEPGAAARIESELIVN